MVVNFDRANAVRLFIRTVIQHAYDGVIEDIVSNLENGPPGQKPAQHTVDLHKWYCQLDNQDQQNIKRIIEESVHSAIFAALVILDGDAGGYPITGKLSDFALYLQTYADTNAEEIDTSQMSTKINPWNATEDMHDIFCWLLEDRSGS